MARKDSGWWDGFFPAFPQLFRIVPQRATNRQLRYITKKLGLKPGQSFLDCPCGNGRMALPMAKTGIKVTGVDITESYLAELTRRAARRGLKVDLHRRDMRRINFDSKFDACGNLWTSFGYFEKESDNLLVLKKMYKALKPGGKFVLHLINRDWIIANYESTDWLQVGDTTVLNKREFDYATSSNPETWTFIKDGRKSTFKTNIRLYSYHELLTMFRSAGFVDIEGYGSIKDEPISRNSQMMFIFGARPRRPGSRKK